jgi:hypothetical protein
MKKSVKTFEEFIGDLHDKHVVKKRTKYKHGKEVFSLDTNEPGKKYDQEADGSDQINRSTIQRYSPAER